LIFRKALSVIREVKDFMGAGFMKQSDAFGALYASNQGRIRALLTRMVGPQDAEDLTQITFSKVAQALPQFRGESEISTWLHRMAVNTGLDWLRSRPAHEAKLSVPLPDAADEETTRALASAAAVDPPLSPEQEVAHKDMHECIRAEIVKLPAAYRDVLALNFLGQLDDEQIADTLGITLNNAKVRLHRARQEFKKIIAARCDFYKNELSCKPASPDCCAQPPKSIR
jgi:RNA polymerase sigma-70 factor, ECF subfamily